MIGCSETANSKYARIYVWNQTSSKLIEEESDVDKDDFDKIISETIKRNTNSSTAAIYKINSIVYGLCLNNPAKIDGVRFLIEGEMQEAIGPVSTDVPLSPTIDQ